MIPDTQQLRHAAALRAVEYVQDGMVVGLGTGNTATYAVRALGERVAQGLRITGVPTSDKTAALARELGIPLLALDECSGIDITIDGADEVDLATLNVIKGMGGALLHEKLVALATTDETLIVDEHKVVQKLGDHTPLPVEVVAFGWTHTQRALAAIGCDPQLRATDAGAPFITDSGNYLLDCHFPGIDDPETLADWIKGITGVVEHGLFVGIVRRVIVARQSGIEVVGRQVTSDQ